MKTNKRPTSRYKPKYKVGDTVYCITDNTWGKICQIDNICNWDYNGHSMPEYYVRWRNGACSRHDCDEMDVGLLGDYRKSTVVVGTWKNLRLIYGKK